MRLLIVDDHPAVRSGIRGIVQQVEAAADFIEAGSCEEALQLDLTRVDIALVDPGLPGVSGADAVTAIRNAAPQARIAVLSATEDAALMRECARRGAQAYITKRTPEELLRNILQLVQDGGSHFPVEALLGAAASDRIPLPVDRLSPGEFEVMRRRMSGLSTKLIARELGKSPNTIKEHLRNAYAKLGVGSWIEAKMRYELATDRSPAASEQR